MMHAGTNDLDEALFLDDACDEHVRDPEFPFALPELNSLIAPPSRMVPGTRFPSNASRSHAPTDSSTFGQSRALGADQVWPPVNFDGEFDGLGVDVRALAPASAEDETSRPFPEVPDWLAVDQSVGDVFGAFPETESFQRDAFRGDRERLGTHRRNVRDTPNDDVGNPMGSNRTRRAEAHASFGQCDDGTHSACPLSPSPNAFAANVNAQRRTVRPPSTEPPEEETDASEEDISDEDVTDEEATMRRAMRRSPRYPALLDAYFKCVTVGASATRVAAAERRKRRLLERAARASSLGNGRTPPRVERGHGDHDISRGFEDFVSEGAHITAGSSSSSSSSKCSRWRSAGEEVTERVLFESREKEKEKENENGFGVSHFSGGNGSSRRVAAIDDRSVDDFMLKCVAEMEAYAEDLRATYQEAEDACAAFEARVAKLGRLTVADAETETETEDVSRGGADGAFFSPFGGAPVVSDAQPRKSKRRDASTKRDTSKASCHEADLDASSDGSLLRETLKRKYAASILTLKDEFLKKRKKGKLPARSTERLKQWWKTRLVWPYPSEEEKRVLGQETGLDQTQINNWFINQRKRHWHKLFQDGVPPGTAEEAEVALVARFGSLQKAIEVAREA